MDATTLCSSLLLPSPLRSHSQKRKFGYSKRAGAIVCATGRDQSSCHWDYSGQLVDGSMIVLRKRMHEMKMIERNYQPPAEWTEWEKQYYRSYDDFVCKFVGILQLQLMNTRPTLALGMLALVAVSVPTSTFMAVLWLLEAASGVLSAAHLIN